MGLVDQAASDLRAQYMGSWLAMRTNPEGVRAKAQVLEDVRLRMRALLDSYLAGE